MRALVVCQLFCCALLLAWFHQATARHRYCSTHGQLIHLSADTGVASATVVTQRPSVHHDRQVSGAHGCAALALLRTPAMRAVAPKQPDQQPLHHEAATSVGKAPGTTIPLLLLAPKVSPPQS